MSTPQVLIVEDDAASARLLAAVLHSEGWQSVVAPTAGEAFSVTATQEPSCVVLDLHLPDLDGISVLRRLRSTHPGLPVIMLTGDQEIPNAVAAIREGAYDYLPKPFVREELALAVRNAIEHRRLAKEVHALRDQLAEGGDLAERMGSSAAVRRIARQVREVAASDMTVLLQGETGTGKEVVAQAIHRASNRRGKPLVAIDCGAMPETLVESELFGHEKGAFTGADRRREGSFRLAQGGTIFLDEAGNLPLALQAKLLRVLEARELRPVGGHATVPLDVRFGAATNASLRSAVEDGTFRSDLYFRLAEYVIDLPPLRDRMEDVPHLAQRFLEEAAVEMRKPVLAFSQEALDRLGAHGWPGNVRELRNVVRRAVLRCDGGTVAATELELAKSGTPGAAAAAATPTEASLRAIAERAAMDAEREAIAAALLASGGNKTRAAAALKTDYKTLHLKMRKLGLESAEPDPA